MGGGISPSLGGTARSVWRRSRTKPRVKKPNPPGKIAMPTGPAVARAQFSIQRAYAASIEEAWALWTTKSGIESWWGPEGFDVAVASLDLRPGGERVFVMTAAG